MKKAVLASESRSGLNRELELGSSSELVVVDVVSWTIFRSRYQQLVLWVQSVFPTTVEKAISK